MLRLRLLGECTIEVDGSPIDPDAQVVFATLLILVLERGHRVGRGVLHRLLWPDASEDSGRHNLRQTVYKLRQLGVPIESTQTTVRIPLEAVAGELADLLAGAPFVLPASLHARAGEFLPGYVPGFSAPFAEWVEEQRTLVHAQLRRALLAALLAARQGGAWASVERIAREVLRLDPLNEEATLATAEAAALSGGKVQAIGILDRYLHEIGGDPGGDIRVPASVLRRRIAERLPTARYGAPGESCFVGRSESVAQLLALFQRAREGRAAPVLVWGDPGIGKTRLTEEVERMVVLQGAQVARVGCQGWDEQRPLSAFVDLVPALLALPGALGISPQSMTYLDRLTRTDAAPPLASLPDAATLHAHVRRAIIDLFDAVLGEGQLVLVIEDVHWLDAVSWRLLPELVRQLAHRRLLLVLTSREAHAGAASTAAGWEGLHRLHLTGLPDEAANALLDAATRGSGRIPTLEYREWCLPLVAGNPFYLQEVAAQWGVRGEELQAPSSLEAMMRSRIGRLTPNAGRTLQVAALLNEAISPWTLRSITELSTPDYLDGLRELETEGLLVSDGSLLRICHDLLRAIVLISVSLPTRRVLHAAIATALENEMGPSSAPSRLWECAKHWLEANVPHRTSAAVCRAASHLIGVAMYAQAAELLKMALALDTDDTSLVDLLPLYISALESAGRWEQLKRVLQDRRYETLARNIIPAKVKLETAWRTLEGLPHVLAGSLRALASAANRADRLAVGSLALATCDNTGAWTEMDQVYKSLKLNDDVGTTIDLDELKCLIIYHSTRGRRDVVPPAVDAVLSATRALPTSSSMSHALRVAGHGLRRIGELSRSYEVMLESYDLACKAGVEGAASSASVQLGLTAVEDGDLVAARRWLVVSENFAGVEDHVSNRSMDMLAFALHFLDGDFVHAQAVLRSFGPPDMNEGFTRSHAVHFSVAILCDLLAGRSACEDVEYARTRLAPAYARFRAASDADLIVAGLIAAMHIQGKDDQAERTLDEYVRLHRRETCRLHPALQKVLITTKLIGA